jgi:SNF2 family DNA or RNA helicase
LGRKKRQKRDALAELLEQFGIGKGELADISFLGDELAAALPQPIPPTRSKPASRPRNSGPGAAWLELLELVLDDASRDLKRRASELVKAGVLLQSFDPLYEAEAVFPAKPRDYDASLSANLDEMTIRAQCSCGRLSQGTLCEHAVALTMFLRTEIKDRNGRLTEIEPSPGIEAALYLASLDQVLSKIDKMPTESAAIEAPPESRLVWRVITYPSFAIEPAVQRLSAKGKWTPGARIELDKLKRDRSIPRSDRDRAFLSELDSASYRGISGSRVSLDSFPLAAHHLIGAENVIFNSNSSPVTVERCNPVIVVEDAPDGYKLMGRIGEAPQETSETYVALDGAVVFDAPACLLLFCVFGKYQGSLVEPLLGDSITFTSDQLPELTKKLETISKVVSVILPDSVAGRRETVPVKPVLLAHAGANGDLDLAIRVTDPHGRLCLPGDGVMSATVERDGKVVQLVRDATLELESVRALTRRLQLVNHADLTPWKYSLNDFEEILDTLDSAESAVRDDELTLVWDERSVQHMTLLGSVSPNNVRVDVSRQRDWFNLNGTFQLNDREMSLNDVLSALDGQRRGRYLEVKPGEWIQVSDQFRRRLTVLRDSMHPNRSKLQFDATTADAVREAVGDDIPLKTTKAWTECLTRITRAKELNPEPSASFTATLRDYQLEGFRWLSRLAAWGVGGCLADDMGLGKTVQMLAVLVNRIEIGPALVIAPTSVGFNWLKETERFAPTLTPVLYHESDRAAMLADLQPGHLVICSYGLAMRDAEALSNVTWGTLVLDEAQFVKNSRSKTARAVRQIPADWKVALTGTPMENHLGELWSLYHTVAPGLFGSWEQFRKRFATPIERHNDNDRRIALNGVLKPFLLRRTKDQVLKDLPERTEVNLYVDLPKDERLKYDEMRLAAVTELDDVVGAPESNDQRFRVLAMLTRLRQLSCHIGLVDKGWTGSSAKLELITQTLVELKEEGHRALVFSQFTSHLALIREACDQSGISYQYLDGSTPARARRDRVEAFQSGDADVFLISLKAGGTGLNLTAADYVVHTDPWWNPAVEDQATDRAHRIGQTKPVIVYRIIARDTIEEQILELHADKRDLVNSLLEGTDSGARFNTNELIKLIRSGAATAAARQ